MRTQSIVRLALLTTALSSLAGIGCASDAAIQRDTNLASSTRPTTVVEPPAPADAAAVERLTFTPTPVRFSYDDSALDAAGREQLQALAEHLKASPGVKVRIVGHADERGTSEYNLSLGEDRARVARDYLTRLGIGSDRVVVTSRGEEDPAVAGSSESAWAVNRRDEFVLLNEVAAR